MNNSTNAVQQQIFQHYKLWYKNRKEDKCELDEEARCCKCKKMALKLEMTVRYYGEAQKAFYYCPVCSPTVQKRI